ncbi:MAG: hypothetical protein ACOH5I_11150 [Oligoflexus sp.]
MDHKYQTSPDNLGNPPTLEEYSKHHRIHIDDVWRLIEDGALLARRIDDQIYILENRTQLTNLLPNKAGLPVKKLAKSTIFSTDSQNLEKSLQHYLSLNQATLDHISKLNQEVIQSKDELLEEKRQQIQNLSTEMQRQEKVIRSLRQQIEDLEILTKTLGDRAIQEKHQNDVIT